MSQKEVQHFEQILEFTNKNDSDGIESSFDNTMDSSDEGSIK